MDEGSKDAQGQNDQYYRKKRKGKPESDTNTMYNNACCPRERTYTAGTFI